MGQAAFQYDEFDEIEPIEVPAGGIATFLTATEGSWATDDDDAMPDAGIASVKRVADQLAQFGRHEDEYMIHAAEGETVIPMEVFRKNPILKDRIFQQMRDMGIEPERYVVGNELNSLNPVTGQPEFFLKKLFKGLKKFVKRAVKVVLPIVATIALTPFVGPVAASAIVSGISTLAQGGDFKTALKAAAIGGLTAGVTKGLSGSVGAAKEGANVFEGFGEGLRAGGFKGTFKDALAAGEALGADTATSAVLPPSPVSDVSAAPDPLETQAMMTGDAAKQEATREALSTPKMPNIVPESTVPTTPRSPFESLPQQTTSAQAGAGAPAAGIGAGASAPTTVQPRGVMDSVKQIFGIGDLEAKPIKGLTDLFLPGMDVKAQAQAIAEQAAAQNTLPPGYSVQTYAAKLAKDALSGIGGAVRKFGPAFGGIMAVDALTREEPTDFNVDERVTGFDILEGPDGFKYRLGANTMRLPTTYTIKDVSDQYGSLETPVYQPQPLGVADGGEIENFPRMDGRIDGPGTETSDDIPAMLSDGEFVFTAKAVRGAGNGDRENGMKNMYALMSKFERMA
tara:strand:+ start:2367 stop:4067 length:1701 start_codon:yes stop_codon:yes gene_type:complete